MLSDIEQAILIPKPTIFIYFYGKEIRKNYYNLAKITLYMTLSYFHMCVAAHLTC